MARCPTLRGVPQRLVGWGSLVVSFAHPCPPSLSLVAPCCAYHSVVVSQQQATRWIVISYEPTQILRPLLGISWALCWSPGLHT